MIQSLLDSAKVRDSIVLSPETYPREIVGPLFIRKPISIDGRGATIYAVAGPVVQILSEDVSLENLKIEVTGENFEVDKACAIDCGGSINAEFRNVEIYGNVRGLPGEEGDWHCPRSLNLGRIEPSLEHIYCITINVPVETKLESRIAGIYLDPGRINPGHHMITIKTDPLPNDIWLDGTIDLITSHFKRCIRIYGQTCKPTADFSIKVSTGRGQLIWEAPVPPQVPVPAEPPKPKESILVTVDVPPKPQSDSPAVSEPALHASVPGGVKLTRSIPDHLVVDTVVAVIIPQESHTKPSTGVSGIGLAFSGGTGDSKSNTGNFPNSENEGRQVQDTSNEIGQSQRNLAKNTNPKVKSPPVGKKATKDERTINQRDQPGNRNEHRTKPNQKPDIRVFEERCANTADSISTEQDELPVNKTEPPVPAKDKTEGTGKIDVTTFKKAFGP